MHRRMLMMGGVVLLIDQVSKIIFSSKLINTGGAFGIGKDSAWVLFSVVALLILVWMTHKSQRVMEKYGLVIIISSGLSNLIDRVLLGGVRDFIYWPTLNVYGNVADVFLIIGVFLILFDITANKGN